MKFTKSSAEPIINILKEMILAADKLNLGKVIHISGGGMLAEAYEAYFGKDVERLPWSDDFYFTIAQYTFFVTKTR